MFQDVSKVFDLSPPAMERLLTGKPKQYLKAVSNVTLAIGHGETFALVGESGCGKSTLARIAVGLLEPTAGTITVDGHAFDRIGRWRQPTLRRRVQMIFQDPYASLNGRWRVGSIVAEPLIEHGLLSDKSAIRARVAELLQQVGLAAADADRFPHQFSGGQRQRISLARALAMQPEILVCDEPTSALDVSVQAQVLNLMKDLQREKGLTYLFISHNMAAVRHMADRIGVMYLGRIVEVADKKALFADPRHPYTKMLLAALPRLDGVRARRTPVSGEVPSPLKPPAGCAFHPRCPLADARCRTETPQLAFRADGSAMACHAVEEGRVEAGQPGAVR